MNADNTQDKAGPSPASVGSHGEQCRCGLATRLVGDGCERCNPQLAIQLLKEQVADMRLTDEEREAIERGIDSLVGVEDVSADAGPMDDAAACTLRGLIERLA
jgi:hypothetical protein